MLIMIDSGSDENCAPKWLLPRATLYTSRRRLFDVQGKTMQVQGSKKLAIKLVPLDPEEDRVNVIGNFISCTVHRLLFSLVKMMDAGVEFGMRQRQLAANIAGNWAKIIIQGNTIHLVAEKIEDASALTSGTWSDLEEVVAGRMRALHIAPVAAEGEDPRV